MRILILTNNHKKRAELEMLLPDSVEVDTLSSAGYQGFDPVEDGTLFTDNAARKIIAARAELDELERYDLLIADDSGLCVDALDGAPGVYSARYAERAGLVSGLVSGPASNDEVNNQYLLNMLGDRHDRSAAFHCVLAIWVRDKSSMILLDGSCRGAIAMAPAGENGFGYDPLFIPEGHWNTEGRTMAEITPEQKSICSHRGQAMRHLAKLIPWLSTPLEDSYVTE